MDYIKTLGATIVISLSLAWPNQILAAKSGISVALGPPSVGRGGPNPLSLPPNMAELGLLYLTQSKVETRLAITGIQGGKRWESNWGGYFSLGAGLVISANGSGFGLYNAYGINFRCGMFCYNVEYITALGVTGSQIIRPYAIRLGVSVWF